MSRVENPWRDLARAMGYRHTGDVVEIPDLSRVLLDPVRYIWDTSKFNEEDRRSKLPNPERFYPEWRFNHQIEPDGSGFNLEGRNSFICVYAKLKREGLWSEVKTVRCVGKTGEMTFLPHRGVEGLRKYLLTKGFGNWWIADYGCPWGLRSRFSGVQLHFRGVKGAADLANVHIDLHNPGDSEDGGTSGSLAESPGAAAHLYEDLCRRAYSHRWWFLRTALMKQGLILPVVN